MIKPAYSVSFLLSINIFVWQNVLYFLDASRTPIQKVINPLASNDSYPAVQGGGVISKQCNVGSKQFWHCFSFSFGFFFFLREFA